MVRRRRAPEDQERLASPTSTAPPGFRGPTSITVARPVVTRTTEEVIAAHLSLSSSTPHLFGDRLAGFLDEAHALLDAVSPTGEFSEQLREVAADIWRR